jgi:hypothetical protein
VASLVSPNAAIGRHKQQILAFRWDEKAPGCTLTRSDDGKYHYGLSAGDVDVTVTIDAQELEKVHRRHEPFFSALLTIHYRGQGSLDFTTENISLEFVKHFRVRQPVLDPDDFAAKVQDDADTLNDQTAREVAKHPEQKEPKEALVRAFLKDATDLQEFVGKNSLRPTRLLPGNAETQGWVLFSTNSKWIGGWKKKEEFILRLALEGKVFEFPFELPPKPGETILRKRG